MMKMLLTLVIALFCAISFSQTVVNFDNVDNWQMVGSGYGDHSYSEGNLSFLGTNIYRSGIQEKNGYVTAFGLKSVRLKNDDNSSLVFTISSSNGVGEFFLKARRWDDSPAPDYSLAYQLADEQEWHDIQIFNNDFFGNENDWVFYKYLINSNSSLIKLRIIANAKGERVFIDDFGWTDYGAPIMLEQPIYSVGSSLLPNSSSITLSSPESDVDIYYTTDGSDPDIEPTETTFLYDGPVLIHSSMIINAIAVKEGMTSSSISSATYTLPKEVNSLSELRRDELDGFYKIKGEVVLAHRYGDNYVVKDNTGGICIEDQDGILESSFEIGDGIVDFVGILDEDDNRLIFVPNFNLQQLNSVDNVIAPELISLSELSSNWDYYAARLIQLNIDLKLASGKQLSLNNEPIAISDILGISNFFGDITLGGFVLPQRALTTGIALNSNSGYIICPRYSSDISISSPIETNSEELVHIFPNPCADKFTITSSKIIKLFELRDASNRKLQSHIINENSATIKTSELTTGCYFVKVYLDDNTVHVQKVLKY